MFDANSLVIADDPAQITDAGTGIGLAAYRS